MTPGGGDVDRVIWRGTSEPTRETGRVLGAVLPTVISTALGAVVFISVFGLWGAPALWVVVAFFGLGMLLRLNQVLGDLPPRDERYTLTERRFVIESDDGHHAYDLGELGELTVDMHRTGTGDIAHRPAVKLPDDLGRAVSSLERAGILRRRPHRPLVHDVPDAAGVLHRIEAARRELSVGQAGTDPAPGASSRTATPWRRPPVWAAPFFIALGLLPIAIVIGGVANPGSEVIAWLAGLVFVAVGIGLVVLWWTLRDAPPSAE